MLVDRVLHKGADELFSVEIKDGEPYIIVQVNPVKIVWELQLVILHFCILDCLLVKT